MLAFLTLEAGAWVAAIIGGVGVILDQLRRFRKQNSDDHAWVAKELGEVKDGVNYVARRLNSHIDHHNDHWRIPPKAE